MKKLIQGIVDFRKHRLNDYREKFSKLALGQSPDTLFIGCSDSRVVPNVFASTDPGDLFVLRNVGNIVPPCSPDGHSSGDISEFATIEFAIQQLGVSDIIVCGHSECGAVNAIISGRQNVTMPHLAAWLEFGDKAPNLVDKIKFDVAEKPARHNLVSQANVLLQLEHLKTYPLIQEQIRAGKLKLHGWWFDIESGDVRRFNEDTKHFEVIE